MSPVLVACLALHLAHGPAIDAEVGEGWRSGHPVPLVLERIPGIDVDGKPLKLEVEAAQAYMAMVEAAAKDGVFIEVVSGYRTMWQQRKQRRINPHLAAPPGWSNHQAGLAIDVNNSVRHGRPTAVFWWLTANASRFGFRQEMARERWHWTYKPRSNA